LLKIITRLAYLGYATPGIIIAVGLLTMLGKINNLTGQFLLTGSLLALIYCYQVRFLATSLLTLESGFGKIPIHIDFAGRSLGHSPLKVFSKIHLHFLWPTLLSAWLIIFIDVMKELAATYIIRPFNFETLAISTYRLIADERLVEASLPALTLVLLGIIPVIFLCRQIENKQHHPT
nr:iron ABC transporter permease [Alphaproteobacteria bacterium]